MFQRSRHYQVFPFEKVHNCRERSTCVRLGNRCIQKLRVVEPSNLGSLFDNPFLDQKPDFVRSDFYYLQVDFPPEIPQVKLINLNSQVENVTAKDIIREFQTFYIEIYNLEQLTLEEEKMIIECAACRVPHFDRFEVCEVPQRCLICSDEVDKVLKLDCGHSLCRICLSTWFREKNTCPFCRTPIEPCQCAGNRETLYSFIPPLDSYFQMGSVTTGIFRLQPFELHDLFFASLIYDREKNTFSLRHVPIINITDEI